MNGLKVFLIFLRDQFDKLLLSVLILRFTHIALGEHSINGFAVRSSDMLLGALIGIITGRIIPVRHDSPQPPPPTGDDPSPQA